MGLIKGTREALDLWKRRIKFERGAERLGQSMEKEDSFRWRRFFEPAHEIVFIRDLDEEGESKLSFCDDGELDRLVLH